MASIIVPDRSPRIISDADLNRIQAMTDARDGGSLRVMEKLGMLCEGTLRQNRAVRGECIDEMSCGQ